MLRLLVLLLAAVPAFAQEDERVSAVLKASEKVFFSSVRTAKDLQHLREVVKAGFENNPKYVAFGDLGPKLPGRAREEGGVELNENGSTFTAVQAQTLWHETQHAYDRVFIAATGHVHMLTRPLPLEMELRGKRAGCLFWDAAKRNKQVPKGAPPADACPAELPPQNYCHDNWAVEEVVASWEKLKAQQKTLAQVQQALAAPPDAQNPFGPDDEKDFQAYCAEFERAARGNPLSLAGFVYQWDLAACLTQARAAVLAKGWVSSWELCPKPDIPDPKYRDVVAAWPVVE